MRSESVLKGWLIGNGIAYAAGALDFIARPRASAAALNQFGGREVDSEEPPGLYNSLASAYMATIAALALTAATDPEANHELIPPLLVAKATSSAALLYRYLRSRRRGFAVGAALDAALLGVTAGLYSDLKTRL